MVDTTSETEMANTSAFVRSRTEIVTRCCTFVTFCDSKMTIMNRSQLETTTTINNTSYTLVTPGTRRTSGDSNESRFIRFHTCAPKTMVYRKSKDSTKKVVWFKLMATTGSGSKEPETPRETPLGSRETVSQSNQRNSPCWCDPTNELKSVQNWTAPRSCPPFSNLVASQFLPSTLSLFHFLQNAIRLMCLSPSTPPLFITQNTRKILLTKTCPDIHYVSQLCLGTSPSCFICCWSSPKLRHIPFTNLHAATDTLSLSLECLQMMLMLCLSLRWTHQSHCRLHCYGWVE